MVTPQDGGHSLPQTEGHKVSIHALLACSKQLHVMYDELRDSTVVAPHQASCCDMLLPLGVQVGSVAGMPF
jgi:hypothetical protein